MSEQDKERIAKNAEDHADIVDLHSVNGDRGVTLWQGVCLDYMIGATAEHERMAELQEALKELIIIAKFGKSIGIGDYFYNIEATIDRANKLIQPCNERKSKHLKVKNKLK